MKTIGLYLHLPFCDGKCPYCDFYSFSPSEDEMDRYVDALDREMTSWATRLRRRAHSLFLGGGTPTLLGGRRAGEVDWKGPRPVFGGRC